MLIEHIKVVSAFLGALLVYLLLGFFSEQIYAPTRFLSPESQTLAFAIESGDDAQSAHPTLETIDLLELLAQADPVRGEKVFKKCSACHSIVKDGHGLGPSLWAVLGRPVGAVAEYEYSDALEQVDGNWTLDRLSAFLENPKTVVPGTRMSFAGLRKPKDRVDVIAFLALASNTPISIVKTVGGVVTPTDVTPFRDLQTYVKERLKTADLAFNHPQLMVFDKTSQLELVIAPQQTDVAAVNPHSGAQNTGGAQVFIEPSDRLSKGLEGEKVVIQDIQYSMSMQVTLRGHKFSISPEGPVELTVLPDFPAKWSWDVTPTDFGERLPLVLERIAIVSVKDSQPARISGEPINLFIDVDISTWDRFLFNVEKIDAVHALLVAIFGTLVLVTGAVWRFYRPKASKRPELDIRIIPPEG